MSRKNPDKVSLFMEHNIDVDGRILYLGGGADGDGEEAGVDWQLAHTVIKGLHLLDSQPSDKPITLVINNFGGEDDHMRAIIGTIRNCQSTVRGIVYGRAESAAAWILQACDIRVMDRYSNLMLHMGHGTKNRHSENIDKLAVDMLLERLRQKNPKYKRSKLEDQLLEDWYIYPAEALELGLCDEIIGL